MKNASAAIHKTPPDVFSLLPKYWEDCDRDENLIKLTHVCHDWRKLFTSRPSLWTRLNCRSVEKTKVYIERSKPFLLEISLKLTHNTPHREEALVTTIPHFCRLGTLSLYGNSAQVLPALVKYFSTPAPLLHTLNISISRGEPILPEMFLNRNLSSLRELSLGGIVTPLPWRGLSDLTTFNLRRVPGDRIHLSRLLSFLESASRLQYVRLHTSIPNSCDGSAEWVVSLPHLKELSFITKQPHSTLLNHLSIPTGALLRLEYTFSGLESPIPSYLPNLPNNLNNLSHITAMNLCFGSEQRSLRLSGPSGELYMFGHWTRADHKPNAGVGKFLYSLDPFDVSRTRWLAVTLCIYRPGDQVSMETWSLYKALRSMEDLRTLTLAQSNSYHFILILNPNETNIVLCRKLEEIVVYIERPDQLRIKELLSMAEERASRGAKLSAITIISTTALAPTTEVTFQLRKHVSRVECKFDDAPPAWDTLPVTRA